MPDLLDVRIAEARARVVAGEAEDGDWTLLILDRQCERLDTIIDELRPVAVFAADRRIALRFLDSNLGRIAVPLAAAAAGVGAADFIG